MGAACCTADQTKLDQDSNKPSFSALYEGTAKHMGAIIRSQALIRGLLARKRFQKLKSDPHRFSELYPELSQPYKNKSILALLEQYGEF